MLGLGTKAKCQTQSLKIEDMIVCGMWQITVTAMLCTTRETFLKEVKDNVIQTMGFLKLGLRHFMPCGDPVAGLCCQHDYLWNSENLEDLAVFESISLCLWRIVVL